MLEGLPRGGSLQVEDDGSGMPAEQYEEMKQKLASCESAGKIKKGHIGVINVHRRLQLYFGKEYGLTMDSIEGNGTTVTVHMPAGWKYDERNILQKNVIK